MFMVSAPITKLALADLRPAKRNPRTHSRKQIRKIADSIKQFGFVIPVLIDQDRHIVAGHGRVAAARLLGLAELPTLLIDHLGPDERRAFAIADNQLATLAGWDRKLLSLEIAELEIALPDLDLTVVGFEQEQIEILSDVAGARSRPMESVVPPPTRPAVSRVGDLWRISDHHLLCGDALEPASYRLLLDGALANLVISDLPYNVPIAGHVTGQEHHREFEMASGEMSRPQFQRFLSETCRQLARHSRSGSLHYLFMDWRSIADLIAAGEEHYDRLLNLIVWVKPTGGMGAFYRSRHELIALFRRGDRQHVNNVELGANGRNRSNVWEYPGANGAGAGRELAKLHPTVKNREMIAEAIRDSSGKGDIVLDPFGGSGTTLLAAHDTGRRAGLIELDPLYCDVCVRRSLGAGLAVVLAATGEPFATVEARRSREPRDVAGEGRS